MIIPLFIELMSPRTAAIDREFGQFDEGVSSLFPVDGRNQPPSRGCPVSEPLMRPGRHLYYCGSGYSQFISWDFMKYL